MAFLVAEAEGLRLSLAKASPQTVGQPCPSHGLVGLGLDAARPQASAMLMLLLPLPDEMNLLMRMRIEQKGCCFMMRGIRRVDRCVDMCMYMCVQRFP